MTSDADDHRRSPSLSKDLKRLADRHEGSENNDAHWRGRFILG